MGFGRRSLLGLFAIWVSACGVEFDVQSCRAACGQAARCGADETAADCGRVCDALESPDVSGADDCIDAFNTYTGCIASASCQVFTSTSACRAEFCGLADCGVLPEELPEGCGD